MRNETLNQNSEIEFADDIAREAWQYRNEIDRILLILPPEEDIFNPKAIRFDRENRERGSQVIFSVGTVIATGRRGITLVPERTLVALQTLNIPFEIVELDQFNLPPTS